MPKYLILRIIKVCKCGEKLSKVVYTEAEARQCLLEFWDRHSGDGHGPIAGEEHKLQSGRRRFNIELATIDEIDQALDWIEKNG